MVSSQNKIFKNVIVLKRNSRKREKSPIRAKVARKCGGPNWRQVDKGRTTLRRPEAPPI